MPQSLQIYIIDDAMALCGDLRGWFEQLGHQVTCCPAGQVQLRTLAIDSPQLIVLGLSRQSEVGMQLFRKLETHRQLRQVPMVVVSDDPDLEYEMLDAFDFQTRPFDRDRMLFCLRRIAAERQSPQFVAGIAPDQLNGFKDYLAECSGLHFSRHNQRILERGLLRRIQALKMDSPQSYFRFLGANPVENYDEINKLLGLLTVGETSFFRYRTHREALLRNVIPELIARNRSSRRLRFWSAGCSTGEEPYSLAILLCENFAELATWDVQILATDINKRALRLARQGVYGDRALRLMEKFLQEKYFQKQGVHYLISPQVRRMVRFEYLNLQTDVFPTGPNAVAELDLLLCRNVLIYFEIETIRQIVARFARVLKSGGYLFLGHSETMQNISDCFQRQHQQSAFYYQLKDVTPEPLPAVVPEVKRAAVAEPAGRAIKAPPPQVIEDAGRCYQAAMAAFDQEKFSEADRLLDSLLAAHPNNPDYLVAKGLLLANQGHYDDARLQCARAIKENDLLPEAYLLRGLILDMEGKLDRALVEYQKVLWLDPLFIMAYYLSAKVYGRLGRPDQLRRALRNTLRCLEQSPNQGVVPFSGGLSRAVFLQVARQELAAAEAV